MPKNPMISYTVQSTKWGEFPVDMLRRDEARAATPEDAAMIERLSAWSDKSDLPKTVQVSLVAPARSGIPLVARWESFGWKVIACSDPTVVLDTTRLDADDLRVKLVRKIADGVVRLRGHIHMARPVYDAIKHASEVAARDMPHRMRAIGMCEGVLFVLVSGVAPGLLSKDDIAVLIDAVTMTRDALEGHDVIVRELYIGDEPTGLISRLGALARKFG